MIHNEDSRVKIPAIVHLTKLGYEYISLKTAKWNIDTNIFEDIFSESITRINPDITDGEIKRLLEDIFIDLSNDDLGKAFYKRLSNRYSRSYSSSLCGNLMLNYFFEENISITHNP